MYVVYVRYFTLIDEDTAVHSLSTLNIDTQEEAIALADALMHDNNVGCKTVVAAWARKKDAPDVG